MDSFRRTAVPFRPGVPWTIPNMDQAPRADGGRMEDQRGFSNFGYEIRGRRKKTAQERREQRLRAEARTIQKLLKAFHSVDAHRGGSLTKLGHVFLKTLQSEGEDQPTTPEVGQRTSGPNTPTPQTEEDQEDVEPEAAATVSATSASLARGSTDADLYDLAIAARAAGTTYSQGPGETGDKERVKDAEMLRQASAAAPAAGAEVPSSCSRSSSEDSMEADYGVDEDMSGEEESGESWPAEDRETDLEFSQSLYGESSHPPSPRQRTTDSAGSSSLAASSVCVEFRNACIFCGQRGRCSHRPNLPQG